MCDSIILKFNLFFNHLNMTILIIFNHIVILTVNYLNLIILKICSLNEYDRTWFWRQVADQASPGVVGIEPRLVSTVQCEAPKISKLVSLVYSSHFTIWFMVLITSYHYSIHGLLLTN